MNLLAFTKKKFFKKIAGVLAMASIISLTATSAFGFVLVPEAVAAINQQINYQGKLTDSAGTAVTDGTYAMSFSLYTASAGGTALWTEALTGANEVTVTGGLFSVMLGSTTPLTGVDFNQTLYLGVTIESDSEMSPRKILGAVPSAIESVKLGGLNSAQFLRSDATNSTSTASTFLTINQTGAGNVLDITNGATNIFNVLSTGNIGIGTTSPGQKLSVAGDILGNNIIGSYFTGTTTATSTFAGGLSVLAINQTGAATSTFANGLNLASGCFSINGACVGGASSQWTTSGSDIYYTAGNVGIGTTSPYTALAVAGSTGVLANIFTATSTTATSTFSGLVDISRNLVVGGFSSASTFNATSTTATSTFAGGLSVAGSSGLTVLQNGNVGVGTATPGNLLEVADLISFDSADLRTQIGYQAGKYDLGQYNTWLGYQAGSADNATGKTNAADYNVGIGYQALYKNTTGHHDTANGYLSLNSNTSGYQNTALGYSALVSNNTGYRNTAVGNQSLNSNTSGHSNTADGAFAMYFNTTGYHNAALGLSALEGNTTGYQNTATGYSSLYRNTTGYQNTASGYQAGAFLADGVTNNQTSYNSVFIGYNSMALSAGDTNEIVIGSSAIGNGSNSVTLGNTSITNTILQGSVGIGTTTPGQKLSVAGDILGNNIIGSYFTGTTTATSTFAGGLSVLAINQTGTATSTFANGINLAAGCFSINGTCVGGASSQWTTNGSDIYYSTGNVGIGTTSPYTALAVAGSTGVLANIFTATSTTATSTFAGGLTAGNNAGLTVNSAAPANSLYINPSGNVGIGTAAPQIGLDVAGNSGQKIRLYDTANNLTINQSTDSSGIYLGFGTAADSSQYMRIGVFNAVNNIETKARDFLFSSNSAPYLLRLRASTGNVGLGTSTPGTILSVAGVGNFAPTISTLYSSLTAPYFTATTTATSTFAGGLSVLAINQTGTATSTFANGLNLASGCFSINGTCVGGASSQWTTNGSDIYYSTGNVGIGTTTPGASLSIQGSSSVGFYLAGLSLGTADLFRISTSTASATSTALIVTSAGKLGLGTTSPYAVLSVAGDASVTRLDVTNASATSTIAGGLSVGGGGLVYDYSSGVTTVDNLNLGTLNFDTDAGIVTWTDLPVSSSATAGTVESYRAKIDGNALLSVYAESDGAGGIRNSRVGIGTTTPYAALSVVGTTTTATSRAFEVTDSAYTSRLVVLDSGNVGIGTTTPGSIFSIQGVGNFVASATSTLTNGLNVAAIN
ncbi:MAG: hypothetical protein WCT25_04020, partial [Candidatus Paceibacterota bacterium]